MISAKVICDSISEEGIRLTTLEIHFHRFILPEFNTHRAFSKNTRSSRAVPIQIYINEVLNRPAIPVEWGKNQSGMQARELLDSDTAAKAVDIWLTARDSMVQYASELNKLNVHKQITNRLLEPFLWTDMVVTSTEWENFDKLRNHPDAQPEIRELAREITKVFCCSEPRLLKRYEWHLPYIEPHIFKNLTGEIEKNSSLDNAIKISVARCARVSYKLFDGTNSTIEKDLALYNKLVAEDPIHASPSEHQATPNWKVYFGAGGEEWKHGNMGGNLGPGWIQNRKLIEQGMLNG